MPIQFVSSINKERLFHHSTGFFVYKLIKYIQNKEKPKLSKQDKKKAQKSEKKLMKSPNSPKASASPKAKTNQSSGTPNGNKKKSKTS